jgi:hypothetical protein
MVQTLTGEQSYEFTRAGLEMFNTGARTSLRWDALLAAAETDEFFLFYFAKRRAYYMPKHAVRDAATLDGLKRLLHQQMGKSASGVRPAGEPALVA